MQGFLLFQAFQELFLVSRLCISRNGDERAVNQLFANADRQFDSNALARFGDAITLFSRGSSRCAGSGSRGHSSARSGRRICGLSGNSEGHDSSEGGSAAKVFNVHRKFLHV